MDNRGGRVAAACNALESNSGVYGVVYHQPNTHITLLSMVVVVVTVYVVVAEVVFVDDVMVI